MVLADVAFVSAEMVYYDKKTDFTKCCRQNDQLIFDQKNSWLPSALEKLESYMPNSYEHQNSTEYCFEEEKHYGKYKKMSKIFHCCSLAVLSIMMVEDMVTKSIIDFKGKYDFQHLLTITQVSCKMIFLPKHFFTHKLEMFDALIVWIIKLKILYIIYSFQTVYSELSNSVNWHRFFTFMILWTVVVAWSMDIVLFFDSIVHQAICT